MRWLGLIGLIAVSARASSVPLSIGLETSWASPPLVLELLETLYDENPSAYFSFLNLLAIHSPPTSTPRSAQETVEIATDLIKSHQLLETGLHLSTFELALGLHTSVPRIEAAYSWYEEAIDETSFGVAECGSWVEWRGKGFCEAEELKRDIEMSIEESHHLEPSKRVELPFDRLNPISPTAPHMAILYLDPDSTTTLSLLNYLTYHTNTFPLFGFVVRYKPNRKLQVGRTGLSGYGVELALKNTDYLVVDDRASGATTLGKTLDGDAHVQHGYFDDVFGSDPWSELASPLSKEELSDIGIKATSLIMASQDPLRALQELSQDFPKYSAALARNVESSLQVRLKIPDLFAMGPAEPAIYVNGKAFRGSDLNAYALLSHLRDERDLVLSLTRIGLSPKEAIRLISDQHIGLAQTEDDPSEGTVDASDREEGGTAITYWNDIEKDSRYKQWPKSINAYTRPLYPGQLHTVRRNTWNIILVLDMSLVPSMEVITSTVSTMVQRNLPVRFGIVPMIDWNDENSVMMAKVFLYSVKTFGRGKTNALLTYISERTPSTPAQPGIAKVDMVRHAYEMIATASGKEHLAFDEMLSSDVLETQLESIKAYSDRVAATKAESESGHLFINGKHFDLNGQWTAIVQQELSRQLQFLAQQLGMGAEFEDISTAFYDLPTTTKRRSRYLIPGMVENKLRVFDLSKVFDRDPSKKLQHDFIYNPDRGRGAPISTWIVGDLDSQETRALVESALKHLASGTAATRLGFVHIPDQSQKHRPGPRFSTLVYKLLIESGLQTLEAGVLRTMLPEFDGIADNLDTDGKISAEHAQQVFADTPLHAFSTTGWGINEIAQADQFWTQVGTEIGQKLKLRSKGPYLLVNGRLIGPIAPGTFHEDDFDTLELYELQKRTRPVIDMLRTMYDDIEAFDRATLAHLISTASSVVASSYAPSAGDGIFISVAVARDRNYERIDRDGSISFTIGDSENAVLNVVAVVDPISENAQQWSSLLQTLKDLDNVSVTVYLQPQPITLELKLKRFYRYALTPQLAYDVDGGEIAPHVTFEGLPEKPILTLAMDTPPSWIVRPESSPYDLDNLVLGNIGGPVHIVFNLNQLLIEGHGREANNSPPRGLQLQLSRPGLDKPLDTSIMANLGYLQFKATPGVYQLAIRPGRGQEVYELESLGVEGWDSPGVNVTGTSVALASFEGVTILPRFERKPGMEMENVLIDTRAATQQPSYTEAVITRMKELVGLAKPASSPLAVGSNKHADINIFTVASGLLYERFASIMILSVMKNTNSSVKFWFIENFLSPTFLEFIPKMAGEYGFQYEFVTYKWPHWLRAQTEKQRIIWAYKILFLDVLFPQDLDKVIFVDADQIVRVDMKELVDLDLKGHVYGYPPMGDDRKEMEGYRFWKTGYWREALHGRPYHISALYVIDLKRFRQLATGDRLRGQYHALSADPNSLANLDQDLPNSMQDQIPIFTLDKDWLWCQTWCSDESLATAKTIDLCQNPLTKEPKLKRARQIEEWDSYDREIAEFAARISGSEGALAASVDDLAGTKAKEVSEDEVKVGESVAEVPELDNEADRAEHKVHISDEL